MIQYLKISSIIFSHSLSPPLTSQSPSPLHPHLFTNSVYSPISFMYQFHPFYNSIYLLISFICQFNLFTNSIYLPILFIYQFNLFTNFIYLPIPFICQFHLCTNQATLLCITQILCGAHIATELNMVMVQSELLVERL